ncbi:oxidoreductase [Nocardioides piscis]|uniref:SDR family NAD(P)-dependent oxidoreductase n=1 Tax=Nocardioides piscis TaxID=2714938 RepID=A0A6G7YIE5_9ACTN|nr:oxidoreductase [Nocardioides piscis]QIK76476.1 SDR family NAD(P)-dependent oxidoreductase [Nocardioides piscis]
MPRDRLGWSTAQMPRQDGRTFVVTGASAGLGLATATALGAAGAQVVLAVRSPDKARAAVSGAAGDFVIRRLDVADLSSVRAFADETPHVDVLVNNAGVMSLPRSQTVDGFETQLATNHLGHFALTNLLLPRLTDRVVVVGSAAHRAGVLDVNDLNFTRRPYHPYAAYAASKLANLVFLAELQRRLTAAGSTLRAVGAHPGYTSTGIQVGTGSRVFNRVGSLGNRLVGMPVERGVLPILFVATLDVPGNTYVGPRGPRELWGAPVQVGRSPRAGDPALAKALWASSEALTGVEWPL